MHRLAHPENYLFTLSCFFKWIKSSKKVFLIEKNITGVNFAGLYVLPFEYTDSADTTTFKAAKVLICGWKNVQFCHALLIELDHGHSALPAGSEVTFFNNHDPSASLDLVLQSVKCVSFPSLLVLPNQFQQALKSPFSTTTTLLYL